MAIVKREAEISSWAQDTADSVDLVIANSESHVTESPPTAVAMERTGSQCSQELRNILRLDPPTNEPVDSSVQSSTSELRNVNSDTLFHDTRTRTSGSLSCSPAEEQKLADENSDCDQRHFQLMRHLLSGQDTGINNCVDKSDSKSNCVDNGRKSETNSSEHSVCDGERAAQTHAAAAGLASTDSSKQVDFGDSPTGVHDVEDKRKKAKG